jgi:hypothetical protein
MGRRHGTGRKMGQLLVGWHLGFQGHERVVRMRFRGAWRPSGGASTAGRWPWGPARLASPPLPRAPTVRHGEDSREKGIEGLTSGSQL